MNVPRWLNPATNPVLVPALASLAYSIWQAIQAAQASGPLTWQRCLNIASGVVLAAALKYIVRARVTPLADPRDGNGKPLVNWQTALSDPERRRAENLRLTHAPGTPSFYPYPAGQPASPAQPPAGTTP